MASAAEVLRAAATIIEAGWSQGAVARDGNGRPCALFGGTGGDTSKAVVNRDAATFSLYGAVCKASATAGGCDRLPLLWDVLYRHAIEASDTPHGGTNHVHPVIQFNEAPGQTVEKVLALLEIAAQDCEAIGDGPLTPPVHVDPEVLAEVLAL
jgi:hypothetical protein